MNAEHCNRVLKDFLCLTADLCSNELKNDETCKEVLVNASDCLYNLMAENDHLVKCNSDMIKTSDGLRLRIKQLEQEVDRLVEEKFHHGGLWEQHLE